jgi:predicted HD phosphohydrolase
MTSRLLMPTLSSALALPREPMVSSPIEMIERLFLQRGLGGTGDRKAGTVTALEHALQCAQLAEWSEARPELVVAALLHDLGHLMDPAGTHTHLDDAHELRAVPLLEQCFGLNVSEPVRLHVDAKRYLVSTTSTYRNMLSPASLASLSRQGGSMSRAEAAAFRNEAYAMDAVMLRRWDDLAKQSGKRTAPLSYYLYLLEEVAAEPVQRLRIGAENLS